MATTTKSKSVFETLNAINCNEHTEKKNGLTYLSWAWAWSEVKKAYPDATYTIYEDGNGNIYHTDGKTCWVKTGVTINGTENIEYLPIMDFRNNSIPLERITSTDANKAIQRSLTKACARHGLGLYIYAGEDIPEAEVGAEAPQPVKQSASKQTPPPATTKTYTGSLPDGWTKERYESLAIATKEFSNSKDGKDKKELINKAWKTYPELQVYKPWVALIRQLCEEAKKV